MSPGDLIDVFQLVGTTLEGRFVVERVVAEGGFGVVYRAQQVALERPIALKVLKTPERFDEAAKQEFLASFASEAKTIARISHPHIVDVYDFGVSDMPSGVRAAWMALEWMTGVTLEDELLRRRGLGGRSPAECLALIEPVLSALAIVHAEGVAHRDLKPANIMLVPTRVGTVLKLLDFGIAKVMQTDETPGTGRTRTRSDRISYSPAYAAPEQISNGRTGPWTDVHAMGLILSEMLTDRAPFEAEDMPLLFQQIVDRTRPTPLERGLDVGAWEAVIRRSLAVSSSDRYRDAGELLRALESVVPATSSTRPSTPDVRASTGSRDVSPSATTLAVMSTQMAPSAAASGRSHVTTTSTPTSGDERRAPVGRASRAAWLRVAIPLLGLAAVGGVFTAVSRFAHKAPLAELGDGASLPPPLPPAPVASTSVGLSPPVAAVKSAKLRISPATASVEVDGNPVPLRDGYVDLSGQPGSMHMVHVVSGKRDNSFPVLLTEAGPVPQKLELAAAPATAGARPSPSAAPTSSPRGSASPTNVSRTME